MKATSRLLFTLTTLSLLVGCATKKQITHEEAQDLFESICQKEVDRHGEGASSANMLNFGNEFMDRYLESGGAAQMLWNHILVASPICRGAFMHLLCHAHPEFIEENFLQLDSHLDDDLRMTMLWKLRQVKRPESAPVYFHYLGKAFSHKVRGRAALSIDYLSQKKYADKILAVLKEERHQNVLSPLMLSLDLSLPEINEGLEQLKDHPHPGVHTMLLNNLAVSDLPNKRELIGTYLDHPDTYVQETAHDFLQRLAGKDKLEFHGKVSRVSADMELDVDPKLQSGLLKAIYDGDPNKIEAWVWKGGLPEVPIHDALPFLESCIYNSEETLRMLLTDGNPRGTLINLVNSAGETPLMAYIKRIDHYRKKKDRSWEQSPGPLNPKQPARERFQLLKELGMNINAQNNKGETALHLAVTNVFPEYVKILMDLGADPNVRDQTGRTPYDWAVIMGEDEIVAQLKR